jgi:hypothetical protein
MVLAPSLYLFSNGAHFVAQSSPHSASLRKLRLPGVAHNMASTHVVPSWGTDSDGRWQRRRRTSPVLGKKLLSRALVKKVTELTPPGKKKINRACPTSATTWRACALRQNRRWTATDGGRGHGRCHPWWCVFVCVCLSHGCTKTVVLHSRSYKSCTNHKTSNKKKVVNTTLCTTMPWWNYTKNTPVFRRGVKIPLCRHTTPLKEIRLRSYFQNNTGV